MNPREEDVHCRKAVEALGKRPEDVTLAERCETKAVSHGLYSADVTRPPFKFRRRKTCK